MLFSSIALLCPKKVDIILSSYKTDMHFDCISFNRLLMKVRIRCQLSKLETTNHLTLLCVASSAPAKRPAFLLMYAVASFMKNPLQPANVKQLQRSSVMP